MIVLDANVIGQFSCPRLIHPTGIPDAMIAGIAQSRGAMLATRNTRDFEGGGIELVNPWHRFTSPLPADARPRAGASMVVTFSGVKARSCSNAFAGT